MARQQNALLRVDEKDRFEGKNTLILNVLEVAVRVPPLRQAKGQLRLKQLQGRHR
ncbi:hypothetical protein [Nocardia sp. NPDC051981]|uniref:hypothetical protein n=1 Tax=Nocardia sp. NPDC051981 TaxID=3155417 RepID=UPI0034399030